MRFGYTILYVRSVPNTLSFYNKAFNFPTRFIVPGNDYGELNLPGPTTLAFAAETFVQKSLGENTFTLNRKEERAAGAEISFVTEKGEDIQECLDRVVKAGAVVVSEPKQKPWGQWVGYVRDVDGFLVELCTPVKEEGEGEG